MIFSRGTKLSDVGPEKRGITWLQYVDLLLDEAKARPLPTGWPKTKLPDQVRPARKA